MEAILHIYSALLIALFLVSATLAGANYILVKKKDFIAIILLFIAFAADIEVISLTETVEPFAEAYNALFLDVPTWKTLIFAITIGCQIYLSKALLKWKKSTLIIISYVIFILILLFIPAMSNGPLKSWIYYEMNQFYLFGLTLFGLRYLKKHPPEDEFMRKVCHRIFILILIFCVIILIEDSYVIFTIDSYTEHIYINNRSISEDIFRIMLAIFTIRFNADFLKDHYLSEGIEQGVELNNQIKDLYDSDFKPEIDFSAGKDQIEAKTSEVYSEIPKEHLTYVEGEAEPKKPENYSKFYLFCKEYQLTVREQEILELVMIGKTNQEIADSLIISLGTAKTHSHNIFSKVGVSKKSMLLKKYSDFSIDQ